MTLHHLPGCDDEERHYDVILQLPVTLRLLARNEAEAEQRAYAAVMSREAKTLIPLVAGERLTVGFPMWEGTKQVESEPQSS